MGDMKTNICKQRLAIPPQVPKEGKPRAMLLGRTGAARGGEVMQRKEQARRKELERTREGPAKQIDHSHVEMQKLVEMGKRCDTKAGQEISLPVVLDLGRTPL